MPRNRVTGSGSYNCICDRCGFKFKNHQLSLEWTGAMVCRGPGTNNCFEPRHPQDFIRAINDTHKLPFIRTDSAGAEVGPTINCDALSHGYRTISDLNAELLVRDITLYKMHLYGGGTVTIPTGITLTIACDVDIQ